MSFRSLLRHSVNVVRQLPVLDIGGDPTYTDLGQPITATQTVATVRCRIEPMKATEIALLNQQGAVVATHVIFMEPTDLQTGDALYELASGRTYQVNTIDDAGGAGHHLEVRATVVGTP